MVWHGQVLFFFLLVLFIIIHWRVILPARHKTIDKHIFEPAGSDADITFDDAEFRSSDKPERAAKPLKHEPSVNDIPIHNDPAETEIEPLEFRSRKKPKRSAQPCQIVFQKTEKTNRTSGRTRSGITRIFHKDEEAPAEDGFRFGAREDQHAQELDPLNYPPDELLQNQDDEIEARRRDEELREQALILEQQQLESERAEQDQKVRTLTEQSNAMFTRERQVSSLEERFSNLSTDLHERLEQTALSFKNLQDITHRDTTSMVDHVSRELGSLRATVNDALEHLTERIDNINERSAERPQPPREFTHELAQMRQMLVSENTINTQDQIGLADLIRGALPTDRYEFNATLSNGHVADCCVIPPNGRLIFPIDAQFPIGAYTHYKRETAEPGKGAHARNEFRRAILSHILELHQRLIIPNETASSALLFAPSDNIVNDLHMNFPDLIQDSYHAHIWIVSPASVLATLHTLTAVIAQTDATAPAPVVSESNDEILAEIESLRQRFIDYDDREEDIVTNPEAASFELIEDPTSDFPENEGPALPNEPEGNTTEDEQPTGFEQATENPFNAFERISYNSGDLHTDYNSIAEEENAIERVNPDGKRSDNRQRARAKNQTASLSAAIATSQLILWLRAKKWNPVFR